MEDAKYDKKGWSVGIERSSMQIRISKYAVVVMGSTLDEEASGASPNRLQVLLAFNSMTSLRRVKFEWPTLLPMPKTVISQRT